MVSPPFTGSDFLAETLAKVRAGDFGVAEKTVLHTLINKKTRNPLHSF